MMEIEEIRELESKLQKEANQLVNKILKLQDVLFSSREITRTQMNLLDIQLNSMKTYYRVLQARIEDFEYEIRKLENER